MATFSDLSKQRMDGLHPTLQKILNRAITISPQDFMVLEGVRSDEQCYINYGKGRTVAQCTAKGQSRLGRLAPLGSGRRTRQGRCCYRRCGTGNASYDAPCRARQRAANDGSGDGDHRLG